MNNKAIENSLERALKETPSLNFNDIINTPYVKMREHDFITRQTEPKATNHIRHFAPVFVCCAVLLMCFTGWFVQYRLPDSLITLDVNPSIAIITNKQDHILAVKALNEDARKVLDQINDDYSNLDFIVASIINTIINQGYLINNENVVMISVENNNAEKAEILVSSIKQVIQDSALSQNISPQILQQIVSKDKEQAALAKQYSVSAGKLKLIMEINAALPNYSLNTLASMSMEELLHLALDNDIDLLGIIQTDKPFDMKKPTTAPTHGQISTNAPVVKNDPYNNATDDTDNDDSDDGNDNKPSSTGNTIKNNPSQKSNKKPNNKLPSQTDEDHDQDNNSQTEEDENDEYTSSDPTTEDNDSNSEDDISEDDEASNITEDEDNDIDSVHENNDDSTNSDPEDSDDSSKENEQNNE